MKLIKKIAFVLTAVVFTAVIPLTAFAEEQPEQPSETQAPRVEDLYKFTINPAGNAEILEFKQKDTYQGEVIIPDQLDGYNVGYIDNMAFRDAKEITSVTIPSTVCDIGSSVFFGCEKLESIHVKEGNVYLSENDGVLLADEGKFLVAYPANKAGESYTIPENIDEIAPSAFSYAKNLKEITIPAKVQCIDNYAFAYSSLEKVNISSPIVGEHAFAYCRNLHEVILNHGVEEISGGAFGACSALEEVNLPDSLTYVGQLAFCGTAMKSVTIPASVTQIAYSAFGYDENQNQIGDFTIYGESGSTAEDYASASDPEYDYENHFTFVAVSPTEEIQETEQKPEEQIFITETNEEGEMITELLTEFTPEELTDRGMQDTVGAELKNNHFLQILLATVGGIAVVLALTLVVLIAKKPKSQKKQDDES